MRSGSKSVLLVLAVVLAVGAVNAAGAAAQGQFTAAEYPATLTGEQESQFVLTLEDGLQDKCNRLLFHGEIVAATSTLAITPVFQECIVQIVVGPIEMNGCQFHFEVDEQVAEDVYLASAGLVCPAGKAVVVKFLNCEAQLPAQQGLEQVTLVNDTASGHIGVQLDLKGISYTKTKDPLGCPFTGLGLKNDGRMQGEVTLTGDSLKTGKPLDIAVFG